MIEKEPLLKVSQVSVRHGRKLAVKQVSFQAFPGELTALIGCNGCGKTTLLRGILGLLSHSGACQLKGKSIEKLSIRERAALISYLPQKSGIHTSLTVQEVCLLGFQPRLRLFASPTGAMVQQAQAALDTVGLAGLLEHDFLTLSEGQKQLCLLARTLVEDTPLLVLDEPDSSLDFSNRHLLMRQIRAAVNDQKCAIMSIHSPELALRYCDRILLMKEGELAASVSVASASLPELNEKFSLLYDNMEIVEAFDSNGKRQLAVLTR